MRFAVLVSVAIVAAVVIVVVVVASVSRCCLRVLVSARERACMESLSVFGPLGLLWGRVCCMLAAACDVSNLGGSGMGSRTSA